MLLYMYQELELAYEIDIVNIDSNDSDICSIFGEDKFNNIVEMGRLIDFEEAHGNPEWINESI